jgi:hypothetical protein
LRISRFAPVAAAALLLLFFTLASANRIDPFFGGVDLGRHLMNGKLLLSSSARAGTASKILHTNFYSYAAGDTPFINHHWLSGVVYYLVWKLAGFAGLNAFYILLGAIAFLMNWRIAQKAAGWAFATGVAALMMPILAVRANLRPEIFTLFFCAVFLTLLWKHYNGEVGFEALLALPALEVFWVNLHIGFIFGPVFIGAFMLGDLAARAPEGEELGPNPWASEFYQEKIYLFEQWLKILGLTVAATLLNPNGIRGALYPLTIWGNYGIDITENHSIAFLETHGYTGEFLEIKLTLAALYLSFLVAILFARRLPLSMFLLSVTIGSMGFFAIRNQTVMAMFALAAIGVNAGLCGLKEFSERHRRVAGLALAALVLSGCGFNGWRAFKSKDKIGIGLEKGSTDAADFLLESHLPGPILNNLNIGGYLTFHLYPQYRIYVDSRPEAFDASFLQDEYMNPLMDEFKWKDLLLERRFNVICFSYASTWEREFIAKRALDPDWAVVFFRAPVTILLRRSRENAAFIRGHEVPKERLFRKLPPEKPKA